MNKGELPLCDPTESDQMYTYATSHKLNMHMFIVTMYYRVWYDKSISGYLKVWGQNSPARCISIVKI